MKKGLLILGATLGLLTSCRNDNGTEKSTKSNLESIIGIWKFEREVFTYADKDRKADILPYNNSCTSKSYREFGKDGTGVNVDYMGRSEEFCHSSKTNFKYTVQGNEIHF